MQSQPAGVEQVSSAFLSLLAWLLASTVAVFTAMNSISMSYTPQGYVPAGNDSFYHARRIEDTIKDPSSFYEFDSHIHAPEGSWVPWPWAYDYSMAMATKGVMAVSEIQDPMTVLAYIPVMWTFVNTGLIMLVAAALGLGVGWRLLAGLAFGLSMISELLHGVGMIDHHYIELTFILLALWGSMKWAENPDNWRWASAVGLSLGLAPAFHSALFVLQLPALVWLFRLWTQGRHSSRKATAMFSASLVGSTLCMLLGSEPFWQGFLKYYLFDWFHLYVATCTALTALYMAWCRFSPKRFALLGAVCIVAALPVLWLGISVGAFFTKTLPGLADIVEVQPLISVLSKPGGYWLQTYFTILVLITPLTLIGCAVAYFWSRCAREIAFASYGLLSLPLFFAQIRFKYFGVAFLLLAPIWAAHRLIRSRPSWQAPIAAGLVVLYVAAYIPSLAGRAHGHFRLGLDPPYKLTRLVMPRLAANCRKSPGIVLAPAGEGHHVRYHTDCSVIADTFLLTQQDARKYQEVERLFKLSPKQLRERRPDIRYVLAVFRRYEHQLPDGRVRLAGSEELQRVNADEPLITTLLLSPPSSFQGYKLLKEVKVKLPDGQIVPYTRLYRITRPENVASPSKQAQSPSAPDPQ